MPDVLRLWGKTAANDRFHPALFHMLDVGHVATEMLRAKAPTRLRGAFGRRTLQGVATWLPLVIALHDLGKISSPFQRQVDAQRLRLEAEGFVFERRPTCTAISSSRALRRTSQAHRSDSNPSSACCATLGRPPRCLRHTL